MKKNKEKVLNFNNRYHLIGRLWLLLSEFVFFAVPISLCIYYQETPDWTVFADAGVIVLLITNIGAGIGEPILYAPMLGTNGEYLAFITGNLSNLKIPCVVRAHELYEADKNSEEYELIATISVATSSFVTVFIIAIFVLILALAQGAIDSIRSNEWIMPAFTCVVYALFGSLGGKFIIRNKKLSIPPLIVIVVLSLVLGFAGVNPGSVYLVIGIVVCALCAVLQVVKEKKKAKASEELTRMTEIANETEIGIILNIKDEDTSVEAKSEETTTIEEAVVEAVESAKENDIELS